MSSTSSMYPLHGTTILCVKKDGKIVIAADGQATLAERFIVKSNVKKLRSFADGSIVAGFAGSTADSFTLLERFQSKLEKYSNNLLRSAVELAKDWRTDKYLRKLESMLVVADKDQILILTGVGDVIEPEENIAAIGSGGMYALAAARAFLKTKDNSMSAKDIAHESMNIAADICVFSNHNISFEEVK